jgi:hypothetical protein
MKIFLLATVLSALCITAAHAEDDRDQAYGKHDMGASPGSSMNRPNSATGTQGMVTTRKSPASAAAKHSKKMDK